MLLVNGCSHIAGSEADTNVGILFAKELGHDLVNIAEPGGGNQRILRSTIEYIEQNKKPDFVLIGWTTHERFEFSFDGERRNYTLDKQSENRYLHKFYRYADLHLADWEIGEENTILNQYLLQLYLESKRIDYMYCNMYNSINPENQSVLWKQINKDKYLTSNTSLIEDAMDEFTEGWSNTKHAVDPKIHQSMTDKLLEYYRSNYV